MLHAVYDHLSQRLLDECMRHYGARLVSLVLYGSVASGTMRFDSDIDVQIVADPLPQRRFARAAEFDEIEARILFDRDGFFAARLDDLRARMRALGSERRRLAGGYYWPLKPDFKPGDRIEL